MARKTKKSSSSSSPSPAQPTSYGPKTHFVRPEIKCKHGRKGSVYWDGKF